jgi:hypothetical protein
VPDQDQAGALAEVGPYPENGLGEDVGLGVEGEQFRVGAMGGAVTGPIRLDVSVEI